MICPSRPPDEAARLEALQRCGLLDTVPEERFDRLARLARRVLRTSAAAISLVDADRQWFKSRLGDEVPDARRDVSFCAHAILDDSPLVVPDATQDPRFHDNPLVTGPPHVRFYAGLPLHASGGWRVGVLSVSDPLPRQLSDEELASLRELAECVERELDEAERIHLERLGQDRADRELRREQHLNEAIARAHARFLTEHRQKAFDGLLEDIVSLTESGLGFIGEVLRTRTGERYMKVDSVQGMRKTPADRAFADKVAPSELEFHQIDNLFGAVLKTEAPVFANRPAADPRRGGLPSGHPEVRSFLGIPVRHGGAFVAMIGLANRAGGYDPEVLEFLEPLLMTVGQLVNAARTQQKLEESERRVRNIIECTRVASWEWHVPTGDMVVNDRWAEMVGYVDHELDPINFETWRSLVHPEDLPKTENIILRHFAGELDQFTANLRIRHKDGHWIWIHGRGQVLSRAKDGSPLIMSGTHFDITDQKLAEEQLARAYDLLDRSNAAARIGTWELDPETRVVQWSRVTREIHEVEGPTRTLEDTLDFFPDPQSRAHMHAALEALFAGASVDEELPLLTARGAERWVRIIGIPKMVEGRLVSAYGTIQDVSHRKAVEQALQEQAEHTQAIINHMVDGVITADEGGCITSFSPSAERMFGYPAEEMVGRNVSLLMPSPHRERHDSDLQSYLRLGGSRPLGGREAEGLRKDGTLFPVELALSALTRGGHTEFVLLARDLTERKRVERMKAEFVSIVSHELRTPLTSISGALGLVASGNLGDLPPRAHQMIAIAHRNSQRLSFLIDDLLDMEKLLVGRMKFELEVQPVQALLEQALEVNRHLGEARGVQLVLARPAPGAMVRVDPQRLMQVLANLLSNAIKFSPDAETVEISAEVAEAEVRVSIRDRGRGIPEEFRDRIFQKFAQADSSDARQKGGTGLGLAITKELVERMGGEVGFESWPGAGTRFFFSLPLWRGPVPEPDEEP